MTHLLRRDCDDMRGLSTLRPLMLRLWLCWLRFDCVKLVAAAGLYGPGSRL